MARSETAKAQVISVRVQALLDEFAHHADIGWVRTDRRGPNHVHAYFLGNGPCFYIEIKHDFHVVADESDGDDDNIFDTTFPELLQRVADIGLEPGFAV
jgi:hypothetical protein